MKISILLPYKENFSPDYPGAVSLFVYETSKISRYKKSITVFGNTHFSRKFDLKYVNIKTNKNLIIVGGTGLYFTALTEGLVNIPKISNKVKNMSKKKLNDNGIAGLLQDLDNETLENIDIKNPMRVVRAWEVFHETGKSLKRWQSETEPAILPISECHPLVINPDKADLDKKIRLRFEQMIKMGALDEAKKNLVNWNENSLASKAIGASELIAHLKGELSINQAIENASISTRQYAKRQKTWIKTRMTDWDDITDLTL